MATVLAGPDQLLADVQVVSLGAGQTLFSVTGAQNSVGSGLVQMTPNSVNTTEPLKTQVWDGLYLSIFPGTLAAGQTAPDLKMYVHVDSRDYSGWFFVDMSIDGNMFPRRQNTVGGKVVVLGDSLLQAAARVALGGNKPSGSMPTRFTGWKITQGITFYFYSEAGFSASVFTEPPTVALYGDVLDAATLAFMQQNLPWDGSIVEQSTRRALKGLSPYRQTHTPAGPYSLDNWKSYSGGPGQGHVSVQRSFKTARNALAVQGDSPYALSVISSVGGSTKNVTNPDTENLGWDYAQNSNAFKLIEGGRRPGPGAGYFGLYFGGSNWSTGDTAKGTVSTYGNPRVPFGSVQPYRVESNLYYSLPHWGAWSPGEAAPELVAGETAAIAISAQNGQTIQALSDQTAIGGVLIEAA
jgi:hypothetical protein